MSKKTKFTVEYLGNMSPEYLAGERDIYFGVEYQPKIIYKNESRYKNRRTIFNIDDNKTYHESSVRYYIPTSEADEYYTVTDADEGRLDIVAMNVYGTARFWWIIASFNNIKDPFDVASGTVLIIPPKHSLYLSGGVLSG